MWNRKKNTSSIEANSSDFKHDLRMKFTRKQVEQLKKGSTTSELFFAEDVVNKPSPVLDWSHKKRKFVLRKYRDFELTESENEIDCSAEDLKNVFGFEISSEDMRLEGPVAHLGIKTGKREFSVTVPSSLDGFNPTDAIREKKSILPISIYINAEGGWRDVMRSN